MADRAGKRLSTRRMYQGTFLSIYRDRVRLPDGRTRTMDRIEHPPAVVVVPILADGRVLLLRQYRPVLEKTLWELPAGKLDPGESPAAGAARELEEETGYRAGRLKLVLGFYPAPGSLTEWMSLYLATELKRTRPHRDDDEVIRVHRVRPDRVKTLIRTGKICDAKSLIGLLAVLNQ